MDHLWRNVSHRFLLLMLAHHVLLTTGFLDLHHLPNGLSGVLTIVLFLLNLHALRL